MTLNSADETFAARLEALLSSGSLRPVEPRYLAEPRKKFHGRAGLLALPRDTQEVATIIRAAVEARVGVVPYGGGTGLVGGQVATDGPAPLLLSLERMNRIRAVYPQENVIVVDAGVILADVQRAASEADCLFPLSLGAEGTARIGGNLATNAGGIAVLRYGNARDLCLGVEAVLPTGEVFNGLSRLRKNNTGYDLRHLLIGAEGTLGVITAAALKLFPRPEDSASACIEVPDPAAALSLLSLARDRLGEMVSAFELIDGTGLGWLAQHMPEVRQPFNHAPRWSVLMEVGVSGGLSAAQALERVLVAAVEAGLATDGLISQNAGQAAEFWRVRERIPEVNRLIGPVSSHDVSLPLSALPDFIDRGRAALAEAGDYRLNSFGHVGDGNLHYNVFPAEGKTREDYPGQGPVVQKLVHDIVHDMGGSVSAEHGIGRLKVGDLERYGDPGKLMAMRAIKAALDPAGIMNPGAVLRAEAGEG
ncbi:MAG: FAD-binding oxidoreductase [Pseudomonadota bacterium]